MVVPVRTRRKGQFFIISAVVLIGILFFISQLLLDTAQVPAAEVFNDPAPHTHRNIGSELHDTWWHGNFTKRRPVTLEERSQSVLHTYTRKAKLTQIGEMMDDCSDLRIVEDGQVTPYVVTSCTADTATVHFQTGVDADASETDVYAYFDNHTPVQDQAFPRKDVYIHFEDGDSVTGEWTETSSAAWTTATRS
ncbi:hypothetical protein BRC21_00040, partial [Candidatus Saccharibacteria bacterium SW_7_54_9]